MMELAYLVLVHKNTSQVKMLIETIIDDFTDLYIHVDKKNDTVFNELKEIYTNNIHVFLIDDRVDVNWSGFSVVRATINLMENVKNSKKKYSYISLISGQCFPTKNNTQIRDVLKDNYGKQFIRYRDITNDKSRSFKIKCYSFFRESKNIRKLYMRIIHNAFIRIQRIFVNRNNFKGMRLYHGSQWFTITYDCMLYILEYLSENKWFIDDFKYTITPDEHFFQMIIMNSKYKESAINNNLRYTDWSLGGNSPKDLDENDIPKIINSDSIIARKFDIEKNKYILENIYEIINRLDNNNLN